jgi:hypothetical protein
MNTLGKASLILTTLLVLALAMSASAQSDPFGKVDTVYAEVSKVSETVWTITVSITNDENVVGLSVPLKMTAGLNRIVADSAVYTGGRVEKAHFDYPGFRADTAIQCVTLGMIANMGPSNKTLAPGSGRLVTVYVSSLEDKPIEKLEVDTTTTYPSNSLIVIADSLQGTIPDTTRIIDMNRRMISPAFVIRRSAAATKQ